VRKDRVFAVGRPAADEFRDGLGGRREEPFREDATSTSGPLVTSTMAKTTLTAAILAGAGHQGPGEVQGPTTAISKGGTKRDPTKTVTIVAAPRHL